MPADFELVNSVGEVAFRLGAGRIAVVGRGSAADFTVVDGSISRHHARLTTVEQGLAIGRSQVGHRVLRRRVDRGAPGPWGLRSA